MSVTVTSGLFPVAQLPAAQLVMVRVFLTNLESTPATARVTVNHLIDSTKQELLTQEVELPGDSSRVVELETDIVEGRTLEVVAELPTDGFIEGQSGVVPGVAIITLFTGDNSTSLLQWISAGEFVPLATAPAES